MSPRPYRLGRRETSVEDTRARLIDAARRVFSEAGFVQASLDDVAKRAGVARATVYYQFGSKTGLLEAAIAHVAAENRRGRPPRAPMSEHPSEALLQYVADVGAVWERNSPFLRNVAGLAVLEPEIAHVVRQHDERRREGLTWLVKRLHDAGMLRSDASHRRVVDVVWTLSSFRSYDHLRRYVNLSPKETSAVIRTLVLSLLAPGGDGSAR
jgi:AcrR family transcriptional regulator